MELTSKHCAAMATGVTNCAKAIVISAKNCSNYSSQAKDQAKALLFNSKATKQRINLQNISAFSSAPVQINAVHLNDPEHRQRLVIQ